MESGTLNDSSHTGMVGLGDDDDWTEVVIQLTEPDDMNQALYR